MAEVTAVPSADLPLAQQPIPARTQLAAVAWLRWRMFANGFRRQASGKSGFGGLALGILLRLLLWPIFAVWVIGPVCGAGFVAWAAIHNHQPSWLLALLTGVAFLWQFIAVNGTNIAASMPTFEPASLLRYPVPFGRYLVLRTLLGLLTPSTVVGCLTMLAAATGVAVADAHRAPITFLAFGLYALMNIFFARMVGIWMERLLAARLAREIFAGVMAIVIVSFQFLQLGRSRRFQQPGRAAHASGQVQQSWLYDAAMRSAHVAHWLPPGHAAAAVLGKGHPAVELGSLLLLTVWTALFLAGFSYRLHKQYLGEYLSDGVAAAGKDATAARSAGRASARMTRRATSVRQQDSGSAIMGPLLRKEWLTIRSNPGQLMSMLTPLIFVFILMRGSLATHSSYLLQATVGYAILAPLAAVYNIFGPEAAGVQMYLLAPVPMREVVLAKNLASLALLGGQGAIAWAITVWRSPAPIPAATQAGALLWVVFVLVVNLTLGTLRSIQAPRRFMPGQARQLRSAPTGRTSGLLVLAVVLASLLVQFPVVRLARHYHAPWLPAIIFGVSALAGMAAYAVLLRNVDGLVLRNRDVLEKELCGV